MADRNAPEDGSLPEADAALASALDAWLHPLEAACDDSEVQDPESLSRWIRQVLASVGQVVEEVQTSLNGRLRRGIDPRADPVVDALGGIPRADFSGLARRAAQLACLVRLPEPQDVPSGEHSGSWAEVSLFLRTLDERACLAVYGDPDFQPKRAFPKSIYEQVKKLANRPSPTKRVRRNGSGPTTRYSRTDALRLFPGADWKGVPEEYRLDRRRDFGGTAQGQPRDNG